MENTPTKALAGGTQIIIQAWNRSKVVFHWQIRNSGHRNHLSKCLKFDYWLVAHINIQYFILMTLIAITFVLYYTNSQKNPLNKYAFSLTLILLTCLNTSYLNMSIISLIHCSRIFYHLNNFAYQNVYQSSLASSEFFEKFGEENFIFEFNRRDWDNILVLNKENVSKTIVNYLQNLNNLLEKYAALKNLNKQERKFQQNLWITKRLQVSIKIKKTQYLQKISDAKMEYQKRIFICNIKTIVACCQLFLRTPNKRTSTFISKNTRITRKGIKPFISIKNKITDILSSSINKGKCIKESTTITNILNYFFDSVKPAIQSRIKFSY